MTTGLPNTTIALDTRQAALLALHAELETCRRCPKMYGPAVHSESVLSPVMLIGQAPGTREIEQLKPFCWTAGKTLFNWFAPLGLDETAFRARILMSAVCRCFPGKNPKGGDRVPDRDWRAASAGGAASWNCCARVCCCRSASSPSRSSCRCRV
jgi:uracil-DNA glycosylase